VCIHIYIYMYFFNECANTVLDTFDTWVSDTMYTCDDSWYATNSEFRIKWIKWTAALSRRGSDSSSSMCDFHPNGTLGSLGSSRGELPTILVPLWFPVSFTANINYCSPVPLFFLARAFEESVSRELWPPLLERASLTATWWKTKTSSEKRAHHQRIFLRIRSRVREIRDVPL